MLSGTRTAQTRSAPEWYPEGWTIQQLAARGIKGGGRLIEQIRVAYAVLTRKMVQAALEYGENLR